MSDIPLHSIRRNKARANYIPINDSESSENMPILRTNTTIATTSSRQNLRAGKRKERYADDPEEQAGLLRGEEFEDQFEVEDDASGTPHVCAVFTRFRPMLTAQ